MYFLILILFIFVSPQVGASKKDATFAKPKKMSAAEIEKVALLKLIDDKYQGAKSITMEVEKADRISALDQTKKFTGTILLKKGKFRVELETQDENKEKSLIVADGKTIWFVTPPMKEFKDSKTLVVKASLGDKRAKAQGLLQILTEGGVLKYFKVTGVQESGDKVTYFLQPIKKSVEFQRAQIIADKKEEIISQLKYWDSVDNETDYSFKKVELNLEVNEDLLKYAPPKDADVTSY